MVFELALAQGGSVLDVAELQAKLYVNAGYGKEAGASMSDGARALDVGGRLWDDPDVL